ncbi:HlyD family secretion protein [Shewanella intestini]|uniref:HlyD family efflux transporter periplasmic adaptor subunit n=1 Tax=Shewanella intestini TaxID=2017544 RepID=A0ABS5HZF0_9GAMM|nr:MULTISPECIES: HlyD family efflux transporter periplasmic adaptor subunit [Shewanella]MBR9727159.1 HlyD family efflux transporter periplasmic adaptor subunit [Shewanella intestini]MRG35961.1 HlyD family efflux transporter periplasmic adaptor subunit [Shewanella sp. XMDDZSB0408]
MLTQSTPSPLPFFPIKGPCVIIKLCVLTCVLASHLCVAKADSQQGQDRVNVITPSGIEQQHTNNLPEIALLLTGQVASAKSQPFIVPKAGRAWRYQIKWMLPEGTLAKPGQVVVIFDKSDLASQVEQLEATLLSVTAQEQSQTIELNSQRLQAQFDLTKAKLEFDKAALDGAIPVNFIAAKEYADNQFALLTAKSDVSKKRQALKEITDKQTAVLQQLSIDRKKAQIALNYALDGIDQLELKATINGPLLYERDYGADKKFAVGDTVQIGRKIATIPAMNNLQIAAWVNEVDVDKIALQQKVSIHLDAQPKIKLTGKIIQISSQASRKASWGESNWFKVLIDYQGQAGAKIIPGMSVMVNVEPTT